jgi:hypothetical protein
MRAKMVSRDNARRDVGVLGGGEADARSQRQRYAAELQQQVDAKKVRHSAPSPGCCARFHSISCRRKVDQGVFLSVCRWLDSFAVACIVSVM